MSELTHQNRSNREAIVHSGFKLLRISAEWLNECIIGCIDESLKNHIIFLENNLIII